MTPPAKTSSAKSSAEPKKVQNPQATRETVESIVIAVILAFLFRGFVAEAFVIPTGSMAPTLMGRHIDVTCPDCEYPYQTGASEENDPRDKKLVEVTYCPLCRRPKILDRINEPNETSFTGDRILVSKYEYEMHQPNRWDVIVFKFPQNAKQNYIKRLVGLPNELVQIHHGDIYIGRHLFDINRADIESMTAGDSSAVLQRFREAGYQVTDEDFERIPSNEHPRSVRAQAADAIWLVSDTASNKELLIRLPSYEGDAKVFSAPQIVRKPPSKERALLQVVYDTNYQGKELVRVQWPSRWAERSPSPVWREDAPGKYIAKGNSSEFNWLRYRHIYPSDEEWRQVLNEHTLPEQIDRAGGALISDYYAYNDRISTAGFDRFSGHHWVGDLALEAKLEIRNKSGEVAFDLVEAGVHYRCTIDVATGRARLEISDDSPFVDANNAAVQSVPTAETSVRGPGEYTIRFVNADDQLRLWVDGKVVSFDAPTTYEPTGDDLPHWTPEDAGDLEPLGIGVRGAQVYVDRLRVLRDVYYVAVTSSGPEYPTQPDDSQIQDLFRTPSEWDRTRLFRTRRTLEFVIGPNQYFPLGDNSPQSADGRMWYDEPYFTEDMLIGKAMLIYWPHGWNRPIPYMPNFSRMRLIH